MSEVTSACLDAAKSEVAESKAAATAHARELRSQLEARLAIAEAAAAAGSKLAADKAEAVEAKVGECGWLAMVHTRGKR